jgi:hypothetical protein
MPAKISIKSIPTTPAERRLLRAFRGLKNARVNPMYYYERKLRFRMPDGTDIFVTILKE